MTDDADRASEYEERMRQDALTKRKPEPKPCGFCLNCGSSVGTARLLFCDEDCRDDYEHRKRCSR